MEIKHSKFAICAIASPLEKNYLDEWVSYHKKIGVEAFFICTNGWDWDTKAEGVYTTRIDGRNKQCEYYTKFTHEMASFVDWCAYIDIDEFIKLGSRHKSVLDLVNDNPYVDSIMLNWRLFGSSGKHFDGDYSVLKRFTMRQKGFNKLLKTILNLGKLKSFGDDKRIFFRCPHYACVRAQYALNQYAVDGREVHGPCDTNCNLLKDEDAWLAHFFCKTPEEWKLKQKQGRVDVPEGNSMVYRKDEEFAQHDFNEVEDTSLREVLEGERND